MPTTASPTKPRSRAGATKPRPRPVEDVPLDTGPADAPEDSKESGVVKAMQADAATSHQDPPDGAPDLRPYAGLRRRERAAFLRALAPLIEQVGEDPQKAAEDLQQGSCVLGAARMMDLAADAEDALVVAAQDPEEFTAWAETAREDAVINLALWYLGRFQVGEAVASSSS